jgi:acyl transferase domain-containing protein/NADPH:quinone reductase-like Zn-dependent oxidoreductase/acyl carrier protein
MRNEWENREVVEIGSFTQGETQIGESPVSRDRSRHLLVLSARNEQALIALVRRYRGWLERHPDAAISDVAYTAGTGRRHMEERAALIVGSIDEAENLLANLELGQSAAGLFRDRVNGKQKVAWLFTEGSRTIGIGQEVDRSQRIVREVLARYSLPMDNGGTGNGTWKAELFALQVGIAELFMNHGKEPPVVLGHGAGICAAAVVAGILSVEDGLRLITKRAELMGRLGCSGDGLSVNLDKSGKALLEEFDAFISGLDFRPAERAFVCIQTGAVVARGETLKIDRLRQLVHEPSSVDHEIRIVAELGIGVLIEFGPNPVFSGPTDRHWPADVKRPVLISVLQSGKPEEQQIIEALAQSYVHGLTPNFAAWDWGWRRRKLALPRYPFQRTRYLVDGAVEFSSSSRRSGSLLGVRQELGSGEVIYNQLLSHQEQRWLSEHRVFERAIVPGAFYMAMVLATRAGSCRLMNGVVVRPLWFADGQTSQQLQLVLKPITDGDKEQRRFEVFSRAEKSWDLDHGESSADPNNDSNGCWTLHAQGLLDAPDNPSKEQDSSWVTLGNDGPDSLSNGPERDSYVGRSFRLRERLETSAADDFYHRMAVAGIQFGPSFQMVTALWSDQGEALGEIDADVEVKAGSGPIHPTVLDACFHVMAAALGKQEVYVPFEWGELQLSGAAPERFYCYAQLRDQAPDLRETVTGDLWLIDEAGQSLGHVKGLVLKRMTPHNVPAQNKDASIQSWLYHLAWQEQALIPNAEAQKTIDRVSWWLVLSDKEGFGRQLAECLVRRGQECVAVHPAEEYQQWDDGSYGLAGEDPAAWERLLKEHCRPGQHLAGVVHLWSLDSRDIVHTTTCTLKEDVRHSCASALALVQGLVRCDIVPAKGLWFVTRGAQLVTHENADNAERRTNHQSLIATHFSREASSLAQSPLWGLAKVMALEHPELGCRCVDLEHETDRSLVPAHSSELANLETELLYPEPESQIAWRGGRRFVARLQRGAGSADDLILPKENDYYLEKAAEGTLEGLQLVIAELSPPGPGEVQLEVRAVGLNFRDVLNALGMYPGDPGPLGGEAAGRIVAVGAEVSDFSIGDEVLGFVTGAFRSRVNVPAALLAHQPRTMSPDGAATISITFATAQTVFERAALARGERVLIHAASGGVGLAAIQLARSIGAEIFATAGIAKQAYLRSLGIEHVYDSRSTAFREQILADTGDRGVDVVLNSLTGEGFIEASLNTLAPGGRFVEIGKRGIWTAEQVKLSRPDVRYEIVALDQDIVQEPLRVGTVLRELVNRFEEGQLAPLPKKRYGLIEARTAFREMQQARHIGKIVLAMPGFLTGRFDSEGVYLVTGGLGGLGLKLTRWLVERGARHVVLNARRSPESKVETVLQELRQSGAQIEVILADVAQAAEAGRMFEQIRSKGRHLAGVFHLAGVLRDGVVLNQNWQRFEEVLAPKVLGAWHLHQLTLEQAPELFVLFSSVASLLGNHGQSNYSAANMFLDALAHHRRGLGLPALSINWGAWSEVGMAVQGQGQSQAPAGIRGLEWITPERGLQVLPDLFWRSRGQIGVLPIEWKLFAHGSWKANPLLARIINSKSANQPKGGGEQRHTGTRRRLERLQPEERLRFLTEYLQGEVAKVLQLGSAPGIEVGFRELGMDSLMSIEFRNRLNRDLRLNPALRASAVFDFPNIRSLATKVTSLLADAHPQLESGQTKPVTSLSRVLDQAIAVVGLACRFPGAGDSRGFWELMADGRDAISEVPVDRWDLEVYFDPDPEKPGKMYTRHGGFVENLDKFDPGFFHISPREAVSMDPQQRLLLELSWEALEMGAFSPEGLKESRTGVYMGLSTTDYADLVKLAGPEGIDAYLETGTAHSTAVGRISYLLGLQGPSVAIDTACSSSLVAIHQACQDLLSRRCDLALAGGVNAILRPEIGINFCKARMLARNGRCKTFDASADGYVRSEGCGVIVLKRLSDAERDGDRILALIRGSAVNQDGRSSGFTAPHGPSQERVIEEALAQAGLQPREVVYLEAHGTGTSLGDPIEVQAAAAVLGKERTRNKPLLIGSVKTNIGHLEAAAGIAGLIKVILAMEHGVIPKHLHLNQPNPHIPWEQLPVKVTSETTRWPDGKKIAGVSSFGFSGTNAHVIVEEAPAKSVNLAPTGQKNLAQGFDPGSTTPRQLALKVASEERDYNILAFSARNDAALKELAGRYRDWLNEHPDAEINDVAYTLGIGRAHLEERAALVVGSAEEAKQQLSCLQQGEVSHALFRNKVSNKPKVAWLFTGQGSQYVGMGRELYQSQPVVREVFDRCERLLKDKREHSLLEVLFEREEDLHSTCYTQPALFVLEVALAELLKNWGQQPDIVLGHSAGQYAAAVVAGVLTLEDGLRLISKRAELMGSLPAGGAMAAIFGPDDVVEELLKTTPTLSLAANNGTHAVLSGPTVALEKVLAGLDKRGIHTVRLNTSHAFHSALMEPILDAFEVFAGELEFGPAKRTFICNLTGNALVPGQVLEPVYWRRHIREPVLFGRSVQTLAELGVELLVEVGPQPVLLGMMEGCWPTETAPLPVRMPILRRGQAEERQIAEVQAQLYVQGLTTDFAAWDRPQRRRKLALPTYPFQRSRYWIDTNQRAVPNRISSSTLALLAEGKSEELIRQLEQSGKLSQTQIQTAKGLFDVLYQQHEQEAAIRAVGDCLYEVGWRPGQVQTLPRTLPPGNWLLFADRKGWAVGLAELLNRFGQQTRLLYFDEVTAPGSLEQVLDELASTGPPLRHIVQFWSLDLPNAIDAVSLDKMERICLLSTLELVQALLQRNVSNTSLHLVTRGAHAISAGDHVNPIQSPLWGFGKVINLELPQIQSRLVDLPFDAEIEADLVETLLAALVISDDEDQVLLRGRQRYVPRLQQVRPDLKPTPLPLRADAKYLITGGLGTLGLATAHWLAEQGARNLILASRRIPTEAAQANIEQLRDQFGCAVEVWQGDVSEAEEVERLITWIQQGSSPLRGIVHAAGVAGRQPIAELTADDLTRVLAAKVRGAVWLHNHTQSIELDFFVGFSSIASVWGSAKQAHYAAANAFLDGLMWYRRAHGMVATALNFGPWAAGGMATAEMQQWLDLNGVKLLKSVEALGGWSRMQSKVQGVIAKVDWPRFQGIYQARRRRPFLADFMPPDKVQEKVIRTELVERLEHAPLKERRSVLEVELRKLVGEVLCMEPAQIDARIGFFDLGMDSLMATEFRQLLERILGQRLPATLVMDQPRLEDLAGYLLTDILIFEKTEIEGVIESVGGQRSPNYQDPIAVIGLECRMPGAAKAEEFWQLLEQQTEAISEIPAERWDINAYYDTDPDKAGKVYTRHAGLLEHIDQFDASLFGIAPREAMSMDPQQRLLLEVAWEALERANISPRGLRRTRTGVYIGASANEYSGILMAAGLEAIDVHFTTGNALNAIAGRVAFSLGLEGPALVIDTACSSSLVAVHQACQALRAGECVLALAGGVNLLLSPESMVATCRARMLAPDGRCKTFDASANGYVRSEGCGMLVLKKLSEAERDKDAVLAVIRGSAVNQDGASSGLTVPHGPSQARVIKDALQQAGLKPYEVAYLEAHGTGTNLGDPIEVQAAASVLGPGRTPDRPLLIGSVKTNIGHLEAAAGIAGLIKVILAMQNGVLPKHLHFRSPNPHIPWEQLPVKVVAEATHWPPGRKIAGVSSFGFSGTNAHVVLEEPSAMAHEGETAKRRNGDAAIGQQRVSASPRDRQECLAPAGCLELAQSVNLAPQSRQNLVQGIDFAPKGQPDSAQGFNPGSTIPRPGALPARRSFGDWDEGGKEAQAERTYHVVALSAHGETALNELAGRYHRWLDQHPEADISDVAYTLGIGRSHLEERAALVISSAEEAKQLLGRLEQGEVGHGLLRNQVRNKPKAAWLFTGQGSQYLGMGRGLYQSQPVVREVLDRCDYLLRSEREYSLLEVLFEREEQLDHTSYTQPALYALEVALAELLKSWGQEPDIVLGHSVGQYAAAVVAGVLTLEDGFRLISKRAELMGRLASGGAMAAVFAQAEVIRELLKSAPELSLAADNGTHAVLSGPAVALEKVLTDLDRKSVRNVRLNTSHAFHSVLMEPILDEFEAFGNELEFRPAERTLVCNLTGEALVPNQVTDASYWRRHIREPVQFGRSVRTLAALGAEMLVEVGPQPVLLGMVEGCWSRETPQPVLVPTLRRGQIEERQMAEVLARLYVQGLTPDFAAWDRPWLRRKVALPTYPFQRSRYWVETQPKVLKNRTLHPLLGSRQEVVSGEVVYASEFCCEAHQWVSDHHLYQTIVVPGATYVAMALCTGERPVELREVIFYEPLLLTQTQVHELQLLLSVPSEAGERSFEVHSRLLSETNSSSWVKHASGFVKALSVPGAASTGGDDGGPGVLKRRMKKVRVEDLFSHYAGLELELGPALRAIESLWQGRNEALGELVIPQSLAGRSGYQPIHPAVLDACTQVVGAILKERSSDSHDVFYAPLQYGRAVFYESVPARFFCHVRGSRHMGAGSEVQTFHLAIMTMDGHVVGQIENFIVKRAPRDLFLRALQSKSSANPLDNWFYQLEWQEQVLGSVAEPEEVGDQTGAGWWLIATDRKGVGERVATGLRDRGQRCVLIDSAAEYQRSGEGRYGLPGEDALAWEQLLRECCTSGQPLAGVVHLWSLDSTEALSATGDALKKDVEHSCASALALTQALLRRDTVPAKGLWFLTHGVQFVASGNEHEVTDQQSPITNHQSLGACANSLSQSPLWGLGKVLALEHPELCCRCVDLSPMLSDSAHSEAFHLVQGPSARVRGVWASTRGGQPNPFPLARSRSFLLVPNTGGEHQNPDSDEVKALVAELLRPEPENQIALRGRARFVARLRTCAQSTHLLEAPLKSDYRLEKAAERTLKGMHFVPAQVTPPREGEVQVRVYAAGLNFRDVLNALGVYPGDAGHLGGELAGRVTAIGPKVSAFAVGDEVMGLAFCAHTTLVNVPESLLVRKPASLSFAAAATAPVGFTTAQLAFERVTLRKDERVLIHAATGGVGLAAIQLARAIGAEIFATASAPKQHYLRALGIEHVYDSRSTAFGEQILRDTNNQGVDVVLNSLTGEGFILASLSALGPGGRFVEIGKQGIWTAEQMRAARPDVQYEIVALDHQMVQEPEEVGLALNQLVLRLKSSELRALPKSLYGLAEAPEAFRQMQQAKHIGKIVLEVSPLVNGLDEEGVYLITGGLGGLGIKLAHWLIQQGARHLMINGRRPPSVRTEEALETLRQMGVQIEVMLADVAQAAEVKRLLQGIEESGRRLSGIFHLAGTLRDGAVLNQSWQQFEEVFAPKVLGAWHLHQLTRERAPDLFVFFSSMASLVGNQGQSNYAAANLFLDALAHYRRRSGLPAISINWGPWSEVGMAVRQQSRARSSRDLPGLDWIEPERGLKVLERILFSNPSQIGVLPINWSLFARSYWKTNPILAEVLTATRTEADRVSGTRARIALRRRLDRAAAEERPRLLTEYLQGEVMGVLRLRSVPEVHVGFRELGMDSLTAVEFRNQLNRALELNPSLPASALFDFPNINVLAQHLTVQLEATGLSDGASDSGQRSTDLRFDKEQNAPSSGSGAVLAQLKGLSDEEVEQLLIDELSSRNNNGNG